MNQQQLNPTNPNDAVQIIDALTANVNIGNRQENALFNVALATLNKYVAETSKKAETRPKSTAKRVTKRNTKPITKK